MNPKLAPYVTTFRRSYTLRPGPGTPWPLFFASLKNILLKPKKTPFLLLFLLLPLVVTIFISSSLDTYTTSSGTTSATGGQAWFEDIHSVLFFPLILPIVTAVYATGAIGEEVEGKTLPYLFVRPVYRSWILIARSVSSFVAAAILGIVALTLTFFVALSFTANPFDYLQELFAYWTAVALVVFATGGIFLLFGVLLPRLAMVLIVIYLFVWETLLSNLLPSNVLKLSFVWYENAYISSFIHRQAGFLSQLLIDQPGPGEAATVLLVTGILGILVSLFVVSFRDYNV